ncbi:unnamed protein product, partial [Discosporangium mesarthrocarpum]
QEQHKEALKELLLKQEQEEFNFKPKLPQRQLEGRPSIDQRIRESTERWAQAREEREHLRLKKEAEGCTFAPTIGGGGERRFKSSGAQVAAADSGSGAAAAATTTDDSVVPGSALAKGPKLRRRSSSAPRTRGVQPRGLSFEARSKEYQEAREKRLNLLREEHLRQESEEATFHPKISGSGGKGASAGVAAVG